MKIIQLQLYVLICCRAVVSDQLTDLGSNVTINCDLDENEVYWILLKTPDPPTVILWSFSTSTSPFYSNKTFRKKYSLQFKHRLVINNVTADELGVYYCMNTDTPPKLSNSTRLTFNESTQITESHNHTTVEFIDQNQTQCRIIIIISGLMNGLQLIVVIVFAVGKTERLEKYDPDLLQTRVIYQSHNPNRLTFKHRLVINNVTADELGVYYCMNTDTPPKLSNGTRLHFTESTQITECHNHTAVECIDQNQTQCQIIIIISGLMNGLLLIVVIVSLQETVTAVIGGSALLPCSSSEHDPKPQDTDVHWRHNGSKNVYDIVKGEDSLEKQDPRYTNRTERLPDVYLRGNFSIKLNNLTHTDAGKYTCYITLSSELQTVLLIINGV
ncbi:uncharacterized protein LOC120495193 [Pimephales promelas]|uniref:uncharacterized protein LOC120495193 n=1 Tax=Pimephales promelas TaxID=90988 RepID=UPI001955C61F|nr:uncharacterized protein LOC120495193 [Pimephales promelas]